MKFEIERTERWMQIATLSAALWGVAVVVVYVAGWHEIGRTVAGPSATAAAILAAVAGYIHWRNWYNQHDAPRLKMSARGGRVVDGGDDGGGGGDDDGSG